MASTYGDDEYGDDAMVMKKKTPQQALLDGLGTYPGGIRELGMQTGFSEGPGGAAGPNATSGTYPGGIRELGMPTGFSEGPGGAAGPNTTDTPIDDGGMTYPATSGAYPGGIRELGMQTGFSEGPGGAAGPNATSGAYPGGIRELGMQTGFTEGPGGAAGPNATSGTYPGGIRELGMQTGFTEGPGGAAGPTATSGTYPGGIRELGMPTEFPEGPGGAAGPTATSGTYPGGIRELGMPTEFPEGPGGAAGPNTTDTPIDDGGVFIGKDTATLPTTNTGKTGDTDQQLQDLITRLSGQTTLDSSNVKGSYDAYRVASERAREQSRLGLAERYAAQGGGARLGGLSAENAALDEATGENQASFAGNLIKDQFNQQQSRLLEALQIASQNGMTKEAQRIQEELAKLQLQYQYTALDKNTQLANQAQQLQKQLAMMGLDFDYAQLYQNGQLTEQAHRLQEYLAKLGLGFDYTKLGVDANRDALLAAMGG